MSNVQTGARSTYVVAGAVPSVVEAGRPVRQELSIGDCNMPTVGLGTWRMVGEELVGAVEQALDIGYRLIETASYYHNEREVGIGLHRSRLAREALFVTTKIRGSDQGTERTARGLELSLKRLRLEHVDLVLIHWPLPMRGLHEATWHELIRLRERGLARAIGVSNFNPGHLDRLVASSGVAPALNQVQCNPAVQNRAMRSHNDRLGVITQAWEPLGQRSRVLHHVAVQDAAQRTGKTAAQVVLRWHLQHGHAVVCKSADPERLTQNLDLFSWELPDALSTSLDGIRQDGSDRVDPEINLVG